MAYHMTNGIITPCFYVAKENNKKWGVNCSNVKEKRNRKNKTKIERETKEQGWT
jgi:hypothetical protein